MNVLRRLPLNRLLLLLAVVIVIGVSATALASALDSGPVAPAKPLALAVHDALSGAKSQSFEGISARIQLTDHLLEGANLATNGGQVGELASSPLLAGGSGRLWVSKEGDVRLELQAEKGDTEIYYDGHALSLYDAASNTLYRYTPPAGAGSSSRAPATSEQSQEVPSVAKIEEALTRIGKHASLTTTPTDVAGQPAYTVHVAPKESGSLLDGVELSFDANTGAPLRTAIYSSESTSPVIELAATEVSYGPVSSSVFAFTPPSNAKVEEVKTPSHGDAATQRPRAGAGAGKAEEPKLISHGHGLSSVAVLESKTSASEKGANELEGLPQVSIDGTNASELRTELGTVLSFERAGVRYVLAGSVTPSAIEEIARGL